MDEEQKKMIVDQVKAVMITTLLSQKTQLAAEFVQFEATTQAKNTMLDAQIALAQALTIKEIFPE